MKADRPPIRVALGLLILLSAAHLRAAELRIADGVVVKFAADSALVARDKVVTEGTVILTSTRDDSILGPLSTISSTPAPGDWPGFVIAPGALVPDVQLTGIDIRYAGSAGGAGLSLARLSYALDFVAVRNSTVGIHVTQGGSALISNALLQNNGIGLLVDGAQPQVSSSEFLGNAQFGVENRTPQGPVQAQQNWWGHPSGPLDTVGNPAGQGDRVSTGVIYGQFLNERPLIGCQVQASDGNYAVVLRQVRLKLRCRNATEYRLAESVDFGGTPFSVFTADAGFLLSATPGNKQVYAQFRGAQGQSVLVHTPQPFVYTPSIPAVTFQSPNAGAALTSNPLIRVNATDPAGIESVEFLYGQTSIATDSEAPYETTWDITSVPDGAYALKAIATNGEGRVGQATRNITLERMTPLADAYSMNEGDVLSVAAPGVLGNDRVASPAGVSAQLRQAPSWGQLQLDGDGSFAFRPDTADRSGTTTFRYRLTSNGVSSVDVPVTITVDPVNDPPAPRDDRYRTDENVQLDIAPPGLLFNDRDVDSSALRAELLDPPIHGTVIVHADGAFSYVPATNYRGVDSFFYRALDDQGAAESAKVSIEVTQPPTATNDVYLVDTDTLLSINNVLDGILGNDHDAPEEDALSAQLVQLPQHGELTLQPDGRFSFAPDPGYQGLDAFQYRASDGVSQSNVATVTLAIGITSLPLARPDRYALSEDLLFEVDANHGLLANDQDADTPRANLIPTAIQIADEGIATGSLVIRPDGSFSVRPAEDFSGTTFFVYQIYDGTSVSNAAIVTLDVGPINDGVTTVDDRYGVIRNTVLEIPGSSLKALKRNDSYDSDYAVSFSVETPPSHGEVMLNTDDGSFVYTPDADYVGFDTFIYRVTQTETGIGDTAEVTLKTNGPPVPGLDVYVIPEDSTQVVTPGILDNDVDPDGEPIQVQGTKFESYQYPAIMTLDSTLPTVHTAAVGGNFYGVVNFLYRITDGTYTVNGTIRYDVQPIPDVPVASPNSYLIPMNSELVASTQAQSVLSNDYDPDTQPGPGAARWPSASGPDLLPLRAQLVSSTSHGTLTFQEDGTFRYMPASGYSGTDTFQYRVVDGTERQSATTEVRIRVNTPPASVDDAYVATEDTILSISSAQGLLSNDSDVDNDALVSEFWPQNQKPKNGTVQVRPDGSFRYTPRLNYNGPDEFYYRARDNVAGQSVGRVALTVIPVNDAPVTEADSYRIDEDTPLLVNDPQGLLRNDQEVDGEALTNTQLRVPPNHGAVIVGVQGGFSYTPESNFFGRDTFTYRVYDESTLYTDEQVEVIVNSVNDAPEAVDDAYQVDQDQALTVPSAQGVLFNDRDADGDSIIASLVALPRRGTVSLLADGRFSYRPNAGFSGNDVFQYQISDTAGALDSANVTIEILPVGAPPIITAVDDQYAVTAATLLVPAPGVLTNDSVTGGAQLTAELQVAPASGTVVLQSDGGFLYTAPPGYNGSVTFSYRARAGNVSEIALVTLDVSTAINSAPLARGEQYAVLEDRVLDSQASGGLLLNDRDPDGDPISAALAQSPQHGSLNLRSDGSFSYAPAPNFAGHDRIDYRVSDGSNVSAMVSADIQVIAENDAPNAQADAFQLTRGQTLSVDPTLGLLANDSDVDGDALRVELIDPPAFGSLQYQDNGAFIYAPEATFTGSERLNYSVTDGSARALSTLTLAVTAPGNRAPSAVGESLITSEDQVYVGSGTTSLTANDSDPDGDPLTVVLVSGPEHGELALSPDGFIYTPSADFAGVDAFTYKVSDGVLLSAPVTATIEIQAINDAPLAHTDLYVVLQGNALAVDVANGVLANDRDIDNSVLAATLEMAASHGQLLLAANGSFSYTPASGFFGRDEFSYRVSDGELEAVGRAIIDVTRSANQRPRAVGETFAIPEDSVLDTRVLDSLLANDSDPDGQPLTLIVLSPPAAGQIELMPGGHLRYVPPRDYAGTVSLHYTVSDGELEATPVRADIVLLPLNDPPSANPDVYAIAAGQALTVSSAAGVLQNDRDPDGDLLIVQLRRPPQTGSLDLSLDGSFSYTPAQQPPPSEQFTYRIVDPVGLSAESTATISFGPASGDPLFRDGFESAPQ